MAYLICNNEAIATIDTALKNGVSVEFSYYRTKENINANREYNLVNAKNGKISRAKKWQKLDYMLPHAIEINPKEFYIIE